MKKDFYNQVLGHQTGQVLGHQTGITLGSELLRDVLIPSLVGNNDDIMYWAGKLLARKLLLATDNDLRLFFEYAGWGTLTHTKSKKEEHTFELSGGPVKVRFGATEKPDFQLEAGFIAETFQLHSNFTSLKRSSYIATSQLKQRSKRQTIKRTLLPSTSSLIRTPPFNQKVRMSSHSQ